jgi:hypothetical protein
MPVNPADLRILAQSPIFKPNTRIPFSVVLPIILVLALVIVILIDVAFQSLAMRNRLPRVLHISGPGSGTGLVCLLEPSELFSHGAAVSFYHLGDSNFEELIGIGFVLNVQEDRRIQVAMVHIIEGHDDVIRRLEQNQSAVLGRIIVKPVADLRHLQALQEGSYGR